MSDTLFDDLFQPALAADAVEQFGIGTAPEPAQTTAQAVLAADEVRVTKQRLLAILRVRGAMTRKQLVDCFRSEFGDIPRDSVLDARFEELRAGGLVQKAGRRRIGYTEVDLWAAKPEAR